jgi:secreted trypsin-like serine protease
MKFIFLSLVVLASGCNSTINSASILKSDASSKIINGTVVDEKESINSHIVLVYNMQEGYACTGTLILKNVVLTAAHCLSKKHNQFQVIFSRDGYLALDQNDMEFIRHSEKVIIHENYEDNYTKQPAMNQSDIGLVYFRGTLPEGYTPANVMMDDHMIKKDQVMTVAGYGVTKVIANEIKYKKSKKFQDQIKSGKIACDNDVKDKDDDPTCMEVSMSGDGELRKTQAPIKFIYESEFVLDEKNAGTCSGDSGGPVFVEENGQMYLTGLTSRGDMLCNGVGVYTSVPAFIDWILTH